MKLTMPSPDMEKVARHILGDCRCHEAYTSRKMIDPNCMWHEFHLEFEEVLTSSYAQGYKDGIEESAKFIQDHEKHHMCRLADRMQDMCDCEEYATAIRRLGGRKNE